jgi:geranylgeranyl pyrophosphate synthase
MSDDVLSQAAAFAHERAATPAQRHLLEIAFSGMRIRLAQRGVTADALECVRIPRLVHACVRGESAPVTSLIVALTLLYTGMRLWDDVMDGELAEVWQGHHPNQVALAAASLIGGLAPLALSNIEAPPSTVTAMQRTLARGFIAAAGGQQDDIALTGAREVTSDAVLASVAGKSGGPVSLCAELAAQLAGATDEAVADYARMGQAMGIAWQLRSDWYDLFGTKHSSDLASGTRTLPIALHLEALAGSEREVFLALLDRAATEPDAAITVRATLIEAGVPQIYAVIIDVQCRRARAALDRAKPNDPAGTLIRKFIDGARLLDGTGSSSAGGEG